MATNYAQSKDSDSDYEDEMELCYQQIRPYSGEPEVGNVYVTSIREKIFECEKVLEVSTFSNTVKMS